MGNRMKMHFQSYKKFVILGGVATLSIILVSILLVYSAQAAHQKATQEILKLEFTYSGNDVLGVSSAANEFADLLSQETGLTIQASLHTCESDVVDHLGTGQADLAPLGAVAYVHGQDEYGIQAKLVNGRFGLPYFRSQIMVQTSRGYTDIWDLQNKKYAAPNPDSRSGYMVPYLMVKDATGMTPEDFFSEVYFTDSHDQVVRDVYTGAADCGASYDDARATVVGEYPDVYDVVSVLAYSENIPNFPWVFRSGLDETLIQKLSDGVIAVAGTPEGDAALKTILGSSLTGIDPIEDDDYEIWRDLVSEFRLEMEPCDHNYLPTVINSDGD